MRVRVRVRVRLSKIEVWCASVESFGLFIMLLTWRWRATLRPAANADAVILTGYAELAGKETFTGQLTGHQTVTLPGPFAI